MTLRGRLARKFPKIFESNQIKGLKGWGVNFNEDLPDNFSTIRIRKNRDLLKNIDLEKISEILKREEP